MPVLKTKHEHFFKTWSIAMAYVLGFFVADGNLTKGKRGNYYLEFTSVDQGLIRKIRETLGSNHIVSRHKRNKIWKSYFRLQIGSKIMYQDLMNFGFMPKKSKRLKYPKVPNRYFSHFVRGYFDGDGHVITKSYRTKGRRIRKKILQSGFTCGTKSFLKALHEKLLRRKIVTGGTLYWNRGYRLNFSNNDSTKLYQFLYKDIENGLYLPRKKITFEKYLHAVVA